MHQYLLRVIDVEVVTGGEQSHFIYVKLGPVIFFGFIRPAPDGVWEGTAILPRGGRLPETYALPETLFQFMCDRARLVLKAQESISPKQGQKIASEWRRDPDRAAWSGTIEALRADVETFGRGPVFGVRQDPKSSGDGPPDSRSEP